MENVKLAVIYYSTYGTNYEMARVAAEAAEDAGAEVRLRKVRSTFPRVNRLRTPRLARGACYVWRVWPYRGGSFTRRPLGVSHFCVSRTRPARR